MNAAHLANSVSEIFTPDAQSLLAGLLTIERSLHLSAFSFSEIREHPFFAETPWDNIIETAPPFVPSLTSPAGTSYFGQAGPDLKPSFSEDGSEVSQDEGTEINTIRGSS